MGVGGFARRIFHMGEPARRIYRRTGFIRFFFNHSKNSANSSESEIMEVQLP